MRTLSVNGTTLDDNVTVLSIDYGHASVTNYNDWLKYSLQPQWYGQDITYTTVEIELLIEAEDVISLEKLVSNTLSSMRGEATIRDSLADFSVEGHIVDCTDTKLNSKARVITISFEGIKVGDGRTTSMTVNYNTGNEFEVDGSADTPCIVTITPDTSYVTLTLVINGIEYQFSSVSAADTLILDSINGLILNGAESAVESYNSWSLPYLKGGTTNTISCLEGYPKVEISYNERWM